MAITNIRSLRSYHRVVCLKMSPEWQTVTTLLEQSYLSLHCLLRPIIPKTGLLRYNSTPTSAWYNHTIFLRFVVVKGILKTRHNKIKRFSFMQRFIFRFQIVNYCYIPGYGHIGLGKECRSKSKSSLFAQTYMSKSVRIFWWQYTLWLHPAGDVIHILQMQGTVMLYIRDTRHWRWRCRNKKSMKMYEN